MYYINIPTYPSPFSTAPLANAVGAITKAAFDFEAGTGRIELSIFADLASAQAGRQPIGRRSYPIPATDTPDVNVGGVPGPGLPTFHLPSLLTLEAAHAAVFTALVGVFYQGILADPALPGATMLEEGR